MIDFSAGPVVGDLDVRWIHGSKTDAEPWIQVHRYDEHTYILRQNKAATFEAPFLFLLFGAERVLLLDTGATKDRTKFPLRETIDVIVAAWLVAHPRAGYELIVAHSHAHGDHIAGDVQLAGRPATTVVGTDLESVTAFFGFTEWPEQIVTYDLGGRILDVTGIPGHHPTALAIFDPWTGFLLTGDTVYPGRLYAYDMPAFVESMDRLHTFADERSVSHIMGAHIEISTTPGRFYPNGSRHQPDEPPLQMTYKQLTAVKHATHAAADERGLHARDEFAIVNASRRFRWFR